MNPLVFDIQATCSVTKARVGHMKLPHFTVHTPVFMPVGTSGVMKGLTTAQLEDLDCHIILGNTYHLGLQPGAELLTQYGGLHNFMSWKRGMLTDSGGFQMVSLLALSEMTEEGVRFVSPFDGVTSTLLTPEHSVHIQNAIGADILMQLDDVVSPLVPRERIEEAMWRSIRWLDRCFKAHQNPTSQNLFPIIQGGLHMDLRRVCIEEMVKRNANGYAIGGLSGGESKDKFWRVVSLCTDYLPNDKPRYCMGVGYGEDLVVCSALGVDMYDCVFPTRTARFGNALTRQGPLKLKSKEFSNDNGPVEVGCTCFTCTNHSKAYLSQLFHAKENVGCHLLSIHNIAFQMRLMRDIRESILADTFPSFVKSFMKTFYKSRPRTLVTLGKQVKEDDVKGDTELGQEREEVEDEEDSGKAFGPNGYPIWITNALASVNVVLE